MFREIFRSLCRIPFELQPRFLFLYSVAQLEVDRRKTVLNTPILRRPLSSFNPINSSLGHGTLIVLGQKRIPFALDGRGGGGEGEWMMPAPLTLALSREGRGDRSEVGIFLLPSPLAGEGQGEGKCLLAHIHLGVTL